MIITDPEILRTPCVPVLENEIEEIKSKLEAELALSNEQGNIGIGLAAPQIGIFKTMAIVRIQSPNGLISIDLVNCKKIHSYDEYFVEEGCLSFPGIIVRVKRYREIVISNNLVKPYSFIATDLLSQCIDHEIEHWEGILLMDKINGQIR